MITCPTCAQPVNPSRWCECWHTETGHDLNAKNVRTRCLHIGPRGQCPCRVFAVAAESGTVPDTTG